MQSGKHVILCVDDDQDILAALRVVLESKGYQVATAATAVEGIDVYKQCSPDVIIIDLMMEEVDSGLTLAQQLKDLGNTAPVFFLSSTGDYLYGATDVAEVGASGVFQKPIDPGQLLRLLGQKLGEPARA